MEPIDLLIACIHKLGGEDLEVQEGNTVDFQLRDIPAFAYIQDGGRMRGSVFLDLDVPADEMAEAIDWAAQQSSRACRVDAFWRPAPDDDGGGIRLLFERELDPEGIAGDDPLGVEVDLLASSWYGEEQPEDRPPTTRLRASDPTVRQPTNAWLLMGSESSYPSEGDVDAMRRDAALGIYESSWTVAKQTEPGDLLFFYFSKPLKAIHFVARAVDHAYFEDIGNTGERWSGRQWWTHLTPMVEIEPIELAELQRVTGDMVMLGRSGRYLRPEHAAQLAALARSRVPDDASIHSRILQPVVGRADHPDPHTLDLHQWRQLPAGTLTLEADVERLIVEPLLRFALDEQADASLSKAHRVGPRIVDYVVLQDSRPACAIEVKLRVRRSRTAPWAQCKDFLQAADYGNRLSVPAILIDAFDIHLIPAGAPEPSRSFSRAVLLHEDLAVLRQHILGRTT